MLRGIRKIVRFTSSPKGAKITVALWLLAVVLVSVLLPSAKDYEGTSSEGSIKQDMPSEIAKDVMQEEFPSDDGLTGLIVFHHPDGITAEDRTEIEAFSEWLSSDVRPNEIARALPFHEFPENVQDQMFSENESTLLFNVTLVDGLDSGETRDVLELIHEQIDTYALEGLDVDITGPAGITADTISIFKNADIVLMLATVVLIFILLIVIYRSPLLAITPLLIAGIVYGVVDRVLGVVGKYEWFVIEGQAVSIMLVLLFAVLTDYSLFIFSRYREELQKTDSKYSAMGTAIHHVSEPILFSGGTVLLAMLTLFVTVFEPYNHFAPVFSIAVLFILIAGLTLIPAIFALMGRRAFWPFIPAYDPTTVQKEKKGFWRSVGNFVQKRPKAIIITLLVVFGIGAANTFTMNFSFNLLKSFPEEMSSRQGFETLEEEYPPGRLAPMDIVLTSTNTIEFDEETLTNIEQLVQQVEETRGIDAVSPHMTEEMIRGEEGLPDDFVSESGKAIQLQVTIDGNPYEEEALETVALLRDQSEDLLANNHFSPDAFTIHFTGQTAEQVDVQAMNKRDMIVLFSLVTVLLTLMLGFQTRSVLLPLLMMGTIILSYVASLGFGWFIFNTFFEFDSISYRLPVYTFVFMVALGIDYNIMLVSRIKELAKTMPWRQAVGEGVALTGGVISSAGLILAATFSVLITQPLQELFLFGSIMALGILLDTFIIRGFLLPSLLIVTRRNKKSV